MADLTGRGQAAHEGEPERDLPEPVSTSGHEGTPGPPDRVEEGQDDGHGQGDEQDGAFDVPKGEAQAQRPFACLRYSSRNFIASSKASAGTTEPRMRG